MPIEKEGYGIVYQSIMRDPTLSAEAKCIYAYMRSISGSGSECYPTVKLMCRELNMREERLRKHLGFLVEAGIIHKEQQRGGRRFSSNLYTFVTHADFLSTENTSTENTSTENTSAENTSTENRGTNNNSYIINSNLKITDKQIYVQVCDLLNEAKSKARCKGRLKPAEWAIDALIRDGFSTNEILAEAEEYARSGKDVDWYSFLKSIENKRKGRR